MSSRPATPPTTPPAIAPMLFLLRVKGCAFVVDIGEADVVAEDDAVGEDEDEEDSLDLEVCSGEPTTTEVAVLDVVVVPVDLPSIVVTVAKEMLVDVLEFCTVTAFVAAVVLMLNADAGQPSSPLQALVAQQPRKPLPQA